MIRWEGRWEGRAEKSLKIGPISGRWSRHSSGSAGDGLSSFGPVEGLVGLKWANGPSVQGPSFLKGAESVVVGLACGPSEGAGLRWVGAFVSWACNHARGQS